jgi:hypothetical protein
MTQFGALSGSKGVKLREETTMENLMDLVIEVDFYTDFKKYVVVKIKDDKRCGIATLGKDENFDLIKGIKVAFLRRFITPSLWDNCDDAIFHRGKAIFSMMALLKYLPRVSWEFGARACSDKFPRGEWRILDYYYRLLDTNIVMGDQI